MEVFPTLRLLLGTKAVDMTLDSKDGASLLSPYPTGEH